VNRSFARTAPTPAPPADIVKRVVANVHAFAAGAKPSDDVTVLTRDVPAKASYPFAATP
jgi:hypothetical protein